MNSCNQTISNALQPTKQVKKNLLDLSFSELEEYFFNLEGKKFRAQQLIKWVHQTGILDFAQMTNLSKKIRQHLIDNFYLAVPKIAQVHSSVDGTHKFLCQLTDNNIIETVFIPEGKRGTLCISSQVGCALNCQFCATARQGFSRNLSLGEIIGQLWLVNHWLQQKNANHDRYITNVVMMGMGEPLLNYDNVIAALDIMMSDHGYGLSKHRVTLSTSGMLPQLRRFLNNSQATLALSLHASNDETRNKIVPLNKKYNIASLLELCKEHFPYAANRKVTFEYVMLRDINDQIADAQQLAKILRGIACKINLIPFNPFPGTVFKTSKKQSIQKFTEILENKGYIITVRKTRGDDIAAACGQLQGDFMSKINRHFTKSDALFSQKNVEKI